MQRSESSAFTIRLRTVEPVDLPVMFEIQTDPESNHMAGTKPRTRDAYFSTWYRNFADPGVNARVIEIDGEIVGVISRFQAEGHDSVGYWISRSHWGKGIASRALTMFLLEERCRPLHATAARSNARSRQILEKCGFRHLGFRMGEETDRYLAREIADFVLD